MVIDIYGNFISRNNPFLDVIRALDKNTSIKINLMGPVHPSLLHIQKRSYIAGDVAIGFGTPRDMQGIAQHPYKVKLGYLSWETTRVPYSVSYGSKNILEDLTELVLPNNYNKRLFEHLGKPMSIIPLPFSSWVQPQVREQDGYFTFLCEGTLTLKHNVGMIISAFLSLYKDDPKTRLILKTDSGTLGHLKFPYDNLIIIDKICKPSEVMELYRKTDVFVYPASAESYPIPLINALAADLPAISPSHSNFRDLPGLQLSKHEVVKAERYSEKLGDVGDYWSIDYEELKAFMAQAADDRLAKIKLTGYAKVIRKTNNVNAFANDIITLIRNHYDQPRKS